MLLLTIGLILVGFVLLLVGLLADIYALVYLAIVCAMGAGLVLLIYSRLSRRRVAPAAGAGAPQQPWTPPAQPAGPPPTPAQTWAPPPTPADTAPAWTPPPPAERTASMPAVETVAPRTEVVAPGLFPIADYDELRVSEILPLLPELDLDELDVVREREQSGKRRSAVIDRIDDLMDELEAAEVSAPAGRAPVAAAAGGFPIENYESRSVDEIVALIPDLTDEELDLLAEHEERGRNRAAILDAIDDQFEEVEVEDELVPAGPVITEAPAKRAPVKVPVKKVSAKKLASKKVGAKKAAAGKVAAKKAAARQTGVKKLGVKKLGAKKGPAKKVAVRAKRAPAAKKAPAKKATARKVVAAKVVKKVGRPAKKR